MIHVNPTKTPTRRACDRCHQAKLMCIRDGDNRKCRRCDGSNTQCIFSPPTRIGYHRRSYARLARPGLGPGHPRGALDAGTPRIGF
ncbi:hypothetical protein F4780DRAFT_737957 [Xylariomycetidae sp. FL0641]|nr:hypothetical protein F4780DRAFT_737957 [Xylariomycetidae sp. FL0641]